MPYLKIDFIRNRNITKVLFKIAHVQVKKPMLAL